MSERFPIYYKAPDLGKNFLDALPLLREARETRRVKESDREVRINALIAKLSLDLMEGFGESSEVVQRQDNAFYKSVDSKVWTSAIDGRKFKVNLRKSVGGSQEKVGNVKFQLRVDEESLEIRKRCMVINTYNIYPSTKRSPEIFFWLSGNPGSSVPPSFLDPVGEFLFIEELMANEVDFDTTNEAFWKAEMLVGQNGLTSVFWNSERDRNVFDCS